MLSRLFATWSTLIPRMSPDTSSKPRTSLQCTETSTTCGRDLLCAGGIA
jgi:hypothetical protein